MLYRGRVYYINMTKIGLSSPVYPLLSDDSATIRVLIWGMSAIEYLKV
ncbi:unnamed protein product, partial [marine sediment metagenome]